MTSKLIGLLSFFLISNFSFGQTTYSVCYIHTVNSKNGDYLLKTTPFDNIQQTTTGLTEVYKDRLTKIYEIQRNFEIWDNKNELFISSDGQTIAYIIDKEFNWDNITHNSIEIFKKGVLFKTYSLSDLIDCNPDKEDCTLFYKDAIDSVKWRNGRKIVQFKSDATEFEKRLTSRAIYSKNDTIIIFCRTGKVLELDLNSGDIVHKSISDFQYGFIKTYDTLKFQTQSFKNPSLYGLPKIDNGKSIDIGLAEFLNMKVHPDDKRKSDRLKNYTLNIELLVDKNGHAILDKVTNYDNLPEDRIRDFISSIQVDTTYIPQETEKWRFTGWIHLMNKSKSKAKKERRIEQIEERKAYEQRIIADTINGFYIPKNIEESFHELNRILKSKDIETIKNLKSRDEMIQYHHGLGMWLRNNWGLWGGSRLQQYFLRKGITHPDNMTGLLLPYYYDWLHGDNNGWKEFESK
jgi:hypothetical protein